MSIVEALEWFGLNDISAVDIKELKKKYKKLMIKYHPDNCNGDEEKAKDIVEAFNVINDALKEINNYNKLMSASKVTYITTIIPVETLIEIYKGKEIELKTAGDSDDVHIINKSNLLKHNIHVLFTFTVTNNNITYHYTKIAKLEMMREYRFDCKFKVYDMEETTIRLDFLGKTVERLIKYNSTEISMEFDEGIKAKIQVSKKLTSPDDEKEDK